MSSDTSPSAQSSQATPSKFEIAREEKRWNKMSEKMNEFHDWFKRECESSVPTHTKIYFTLTVRFRLQLCRKLADGSFTERGLSLVRYLDTAKAMSHHLTMHHTIEERYIFPTLAKFMPKFANNDEGEHVTSHRGIHDGLEKLDQLVIKWKESPSTYSPTEMRACLDGFREVLFRHLDEEVADLLGENLKKYMTLADVESLPI